MFNGKKVFFILLQLGVVGYVLSLEPCDIHSAKCVGKILSWIKDEYKLVNNNLHSTPDERIHNVQISIKLLRLNKKSGGILEKLESNGIRLSKQMRSFKWRIETMTDQKVKNIINKTLSGDISVVNNKLSLFTKFSKNQQNTTNTMILNFSEDVFSSTSPFVINRIDQLNDFFTEFYKYEKNKTSSQCGDRFSPQEVIYEMYTTLIMTEISRFCITTYCYNILDTLTFKNGKKMMAIFFFSYLFLCFKKKLISFLYFIFNLETKKFNDSFLITEANERIVYQYNTVLNFIKMLTRSYRHCEPSSLIEGKLIKFIEYSVN